MVKTRRALKSFAIQGGGNVLLTWMQRTDPYVTIFGANGNLYSSFSDAENRPGSWSPPELVSNPDNAAQASSDGPYWQESLVVDPATGHFLATWTDDDDPSSAFFPQVFSRTFHVGTNQWLPILRVSDGSKRAYWPMISLDPSTGLTQVTFLEPEPGKEILVSAELHHLLAPSWTSKRTVGTKEVTVGHGIFRHSSAIFPFRGLSSSVAILLR